MKLNYSMYYIGLIFFCTMASIHVNAKSTSCYQQFCKKVRACCKGICRSNIGIEYLQTNNGSMTQPFINSGTERIWSWNGEMIPKGPHFNTSTEIWAPFGSATSYITVIPGGTGIPDTFVCSKNIRTLRFYTEIQTSTPTTSRWRVRLYLNGISSGTGNYWGAPPNNVNNQRVFGVLEYGGIPAGTSITVAIDNNTLPPSLQNNTSYFVIEYDLES